MFNWKNGYTKILVVAMLGIFIFTGCSSQLVDSTEVVEEDNVEQSETVASNEELPSNDMEPDYETVFNQDEVLVFNIEIDSDDWALMQEDLAANMSQSQDKQRGIKPGAPRDRSSSKEGTDQEKVNGNVPPAGEEPRDMPPSGKEPRDMPPKAMTNMDSTGDYDPVWVESSITFNDLTWDHVGIRFKGNSSLTSAYSSGNDKLSFKLDFDEFEDDYPEIKHQRFYGFKQLNLNSNFSDASLMREKVAADLFREFGLVSSQTSFCVVNVDYGEGSMFYGIYTLVEEMDDTAISQFADDNGNLYKPDGSAASFASGTYNEDQMEKKTNEAEGDYTDVSSLYEIINSDLRETNVVAWKTELETVFNVDGFLKWLAVNTVIQNWDTYGNMTHNYYLYNNPETGQLNWVPWDNNEAFSQGKGNRGALSLGMAEVSDEWPLINYLVNETEYKAIYDDYVQEFVDEVFTVEKMTETYTTYYEMIKDYAYDEVEGCTYLKSDDDFDNGVGTLKAHVVERNQAVKSYLEN